MHIFSFEIAYKRMVEEPLHFYYTQSKRGWKSRTFLDKVLSICKDSGKMKWNLFLPTVTFLRNALLSVKSFCYETGAVLYSTPSNSTKTISKIKYHILKFSRVFSNIIFWLSKEAARLLELFFSKIHTTPLLRMYF